MRTWSMLTGFLFAIASLSCGGGDAAGPICNAPPARLSVVTWNTGLGPGMVPLSTPRAPHVAAAVAATDFDVLCLQEVWTAPDQARVLDALAMPAENAFTYDTYGLNDVPEDRCGQSDLGGVADCMARECAGVPDEEASICALAHCRAELTAVYLHAPHCLHCLGASAGKSSARTEADCLSHPTTRVQGGGNGIMLASRWPLLDREAMPIPAGSANRVALFARISVPGAGDVEVACTHLSATQDIPPAHSGFTGWETERIAQLRMISARLAERAAGRPQLLIGDMNFGRANGEAVTDASRPAWDEAIRLGFSDPAAEASPPICSSCGDNTLNGPSDHGDLIDHALLRDPPGCPDLVTGGVERLYDSTSAVEAYGQSVVTDLSDHYGVNVVFTVH